MKLTSMVMAFTLTVGAANANVKDMVKREARAQGVPVGLALAIAKQESNFRCGAIGRAGERGVMQIKPSTARSLGYRGKPSGLNHCSTGIHYGMKYLSLAYRRSGGNSHVAATLYNRGIYSKSRSSGYAKKALRKSQH